MPTERKITAVADLTDKLSRMQLTLIADYRGLNVAEMAELRAKMRELGTEVIVAKNTLIRIAAQSTGHTALEPLLEGPTAVMFTYDDVPKAAKEIENYLKTTPKLSLRGGLLGYGMIKPEDLQNIARLPSRQEMVGQILGGLQSPITGLLGLLDAPARDILGILETATRDTVGVIQAPVNDILGVLQARIHQLESAQG